MCPSCLRHEADQDCYGTGTDKKSACLVPVCAGKHVKLLHELINIRPAAMNTACCVDTEEEDERCVHLVRCESGEESASGWRTPDASWLDMDELG
jgi:hypothetical protein